MSDDALTIQDVRTMAARIGLDRLEEEHLQQLLRATRVSVARRTALPVANITPADEPAHVFNLDAEDAR